MKARKSKLDPFASRIADWDAEKKTLAEIQSALAAEGCVVSTGRLSEFLLAWRSRRSQEQLLAQITNGARLVKEVDAAFTKHPAPELKTIISLFRVVVMKLSTEANADPALVDLVAQLIRPVLDFAKLEVKQDELALQRHRFEFDATKAALACLPELNAIKRDTALTEDARLEQARLKLFGETPA